MSQSLSLAALSDDAVLRRVTELLHQSRRAEADLLLHIGELDARRLFVRAACSSMFVYCTEVLHLSEAEAYMRITAARTARRHPVLLPMLSDGRLHLSSIVRLAPHLTEENCHLVLARAVHRSKREVLELVAELAPRSDAPASIRLLPCGRTAAGPAPSRGPDPILASATSRFTAAASSGQAAPSSTLPLGAGLPGANVASAGAFALGTGPSRAASEPFAGPRPTATAVGSGPPRCSRTADTAGATPPVRVEPLSPGRYRFLFTGSVTLRDKLERLQELMRASGPDTDLAAVIEAAVTEKLARLEARRFATTAKPRRTVHESEARPHTRHIPAAIRREVWRRDEGRCRFVDDTGRRCAARRGLEFHHRHPFGLGGEHAARNLCLMCRTHNRFLAEIDYGPRLTALPGQSRSPGLVLAATSPRRRG